jgi:hypothetical protein
LKPTAVKRASDPAARLTIPLQKVSTPLSTARDFNRVEIYYILRYNCTDSDADAKENVKSKDDRRSNQRGGRS